MEEFTYTGTELKQNSNFSVKIYQDSYINSIQEIALSKKKNERPEEFFHTK